MADAVLVYLRAELPEEVVAAVEPQLKKLEQGEYEDILRCPEAQALLNPEGDDAFKNEAAGEASLGWIQFLSKRVNALITEQSKLQDKLTHFFIGYAALLTFIQSNVTGPPLKYRPATALLPKSIVEDSQAYHDVKQQILAGLAIDGIAPYKLTPHVELLGLAETVLASEVILGSVKAARWVKLRVAFIRQRLLSEVSSTLQNLIYDDLDLLEDELAHFAKSDAYVYFLLERSTIHIHHGLDKFARLDLDKAKSLRHFDFALTGLLGKRTKFQQKDTSQLVVLAKSREDGTHVNDGTGQPIDAKQDADPAKPTNLDLNDDTLLESISFTKKTESPGFAEYRDTESLSAALQSLDPAEQPQLQALDSIILLSLASSITNTSPQDGLTREETLPYATRVLDGGSSNWQVYTQALLVRSRIEGYRSRTTERGLLQLQALVDQVIAETKGEDGAESSNGTGTTSTFLPRAEASESAPVTDRMRYIFQIATPLRWELEAELAARWVQLGGLRTALEIYERLEMWAEAALCWAATDREDKAKKIVRRLLFHATDGKLDIADSTRGDDEEWKGPERVPPPLDAPRLYCILGDMDTSVEMYEKAWTISKERYARAQRSLGRYYVSIGDFLKAAAAYSKSLKANQLHHSSWFALGCALLELTEYKRAAEAFSRTIQIDETDAEAWSNLGAALLRMEPENEANGPTAPVTILDDEEDPSANPPAQTTDPRQKNRADALRALKRAATLKKESHRIWENVLIVAASLSPPDYDAILAAQRRLIELRGPTEGEKAIDEDILEHLVLHIINSAETYDPSQPGLTRMTVRFVDEKVIPLITASARLWQLVGKLALWRNKPSSALDAEEKAWRVVTGQPGWEGGSEKRWDEVVEATVRLCDSYENLGQRERTEGMGAGEPVAKDWKFKARSAVRGIMGRGKDNWEDSPGWDRLKEALDGLKG